MLRNYLCFPYHYDKVITSRCSRVYANEVVRVVLAAGTEKA